MPADQGRGFVRFKRGQRICSQGDAADCLYRIYQGNVRLDAVGTSGKEATVAILGPGRIFGEKALDVAALCTTSATALTDCRLSVLDRAAARDSLAADPFFRQALLSELLARNTEYEDALCDQVLYDSQTRLARTLLRLCRLGEAHNGHAILSFKLTHETLAQMTGTTRSRVSFFMHRFQTLGLIRYGHGLLVDRARLAEFLDEPG